MKIYETFIKSINESKNTLHSLEELRETYPDAIITCEPNKQHKNRYFARIDIKQSNGEEDKYLGALKGPVSMEQALEFFNHTLTIYYEKKM